MVSCNDSCRARSERLDCTGSLIGALLLFSIDAASSIGSHYFEMNPLTQIKNTQKITKKEIELGLFEKASWHARFAHSAYIFAGGLDYELTEGDLLAVFAQYGELVDVHLVRDKSSGKSKGFAFLAYEDQRSTVLAVDNLSGATVASRKIRVEHVDNYKKRKAEVGLQQLQLGVPAYRTNRCAYTA